MAIIKISMIQDGVHRKSLFLNSSFRYVD